MPRQLLQYLGSGLRGLRGPAVVVAVALSLSACGASKSTSSPSTSISHTTPSSTAPATSAPSSTSKSPTSTSSVPSTTDAGLAQCRSAQLAARMGTVAGGSGNAGVVITLTNTATTSCTLYGFPGIGMRTSAGKVIAVNPTRETGAGLDFNGVAEKTVVLTPQGHAYFGLSWVLGSCQNDKGVLEVTPPNDHHYLTIPNRPCGHGFMVTPVSASVPTA
jgi:hypothetical protein